MPPMEANDDEWIASVLSYVRYAFGHDASTVRDDHVKDVRDKLNFIITITVMSYMELKDIDLTKCNRE